jgi:hypothetical protein
MRASALARSSGSSGVARDGPAGVARDVPDPVSAGGIIFVYYNDLLALYNFLSG